MYIARAILHTVTNSFKNKKIKRSGIRKSAGGYSTRKYKSQTKNRILASESNLRLGSILLVKI